MRDPLSVSARSIVPAVVVAGVVAVLATAVAGGCTFNPGPNKITPGAAGTTGGAGSRGGSTGTAGKPAPPAPCTGLECMQSTCTLGDCKVPACTGGARTTVSGVVMDPAGLNPLYNITVYVPNKPLDPIADGPSCDPCNLVTGTSLLSGSPIAVAKTNDKGEFKLGSADGGDVPAGDSIPLVIQVGKWQRQITVTQVEPCTDTVISDKALTRLPRTRDEGHIPKMAITTGEKDTLGCLLRKIGIADTEFTPEAGPGRVNLYAGGTVDTPGASAYSATLNGGAAFTPVNPWWDSLDNLKKYDIILHSCEGGAGSYQGNNPPGSVKSQAARQALNDYADLGGRVFASHWHTYWFEKGTPAFQSIGTFNHRAGLPNPYNATIDQSFDTGAALASWMMNVGGSTMLGIVPIAQDANTRMVDMVAGGNISQRWIYASTLTPQSVQYLSATTPIPGGTCGRVVLSDLHVSAGAGVGSDNPTATFPDGCLTTTLSPQEKVIEFMLFDIASCVRARIPEVLANRVSWPRPRRRDPLTRLVRGAWTLPTNVVGHLAGWLVSGARPRRVGGPVAVGWLYPIRAGLGLDWVGAITLGHAILFRPGFLDAKTTRARLTLAHELAHTRQHDWLGPLYLPLHILAQLASAALTLARGGPARVSPVHDHNPLEQTFICLSAGAPSPPLPGDVDVEALLAAFGV
jgi:hypothetical protein